ncbi:MAG: thiamine diphosphokinase [Fimbriimonadaceae bacterium]|nr:thiamine diphosphokinase [Fimbriimonadaceae bacterium]
MPKVLVVLAGGDDSIGSLAKWAASADVILAADGGGDRAIAAGFVPHIVVGDLDSLNPRHRDQIPELIRIDDQNATDADKVLRLAADRGWRSLTLMGLEGDRLDHVLASLGSGLACGLEIRIVLRNMLAHLVRPGDRAFATQMGRRVSLIPFPFCRASLTGVRWPLVEAELAIGARVSVSNEAIEPTVRLALSEGTALLFLEHRDTEPAAW